MSSPIGSPTVGIVGAGQLARMTYQASIPLGVQVHVLATAPDESAALIAHDPSIGRPDDSAALLALASRADVLTFDHELVDATELARLEAGGTCVRPAASVVKLAQNKLVQRELFAAIGIPSPRFRVVNGLSDITSFGDSEGWPVVLKAVHGGYDGRGVWLAESHLVAARLLEVLRDTTELLVEAWVPLTRELAILVARRPNGETMSYPLVETLQVDGICREVIAPAETGSRLAAQAQEIALTIASAASVTGILAVELFETTAGLVVNELAARPHNSGHYSIEGCVTSQFENHLRAVLDWPLGTTSLVAPFVATVNVLGGERPVNLRQMLPRALAVEGAHVHLYGKGYRAGRKLGHVTALGPSREEALKRAHRASDLLDGTVVGE